MVKGLDDAEAVRLAIAGDARGQRHLFERHYARVLGACRRYAALDTGEAEDAAQDAFVRAFRALPSLRDPQHFGRWVVTIGHNRCRTLSARQGRRSEALRVYAQEARLQSVAPEGRVKELMEFVLETVDDERLERVAVMYWIEGYTSGEISRQIGIPISTVTTWMSRLAAKVRARLLAQAMVGPEEHHGEDG